jgi:hypothetical protein
MEGAQGTTPWPTIGGVGRVKGSGPSRLNLRFIDWIWHVRDSLALAPGQSSDDAFDRLDPLFRQTGTSYQRTNDSLTFRKKNPAAQDKMSVFDGGALQIDKSVGGSVLRYHLTSKALLFCFLASPMFLGIAQLTVVISHLEKPTPHEEKKPADRPMNPIDKALGAPEPDHSKKDDPDDDKKLSPTAAYIFSGIFAFLYVFGRILEDRLIKTRFKKSLLEAQ